MDRNPRHHDCSFDPIGKVPRENIHLDFAKCSSGMSLCICNQLDRSILSLPSAIQRSDDYDSRVLGVPRIGSAHYVEVMDYHGIAGDELSTSCRQLNASPLFLVIVLVNSAANRFSFT